MQTRCADYSAMIGRQFSLALNPPRRGTDYFSPDHLLSGEF
jgi:hypothetical protein